MVERHIQHISPDTNLTARSRDDEAKDCYAEDPDIHKAIKRFSPLIPGHKNIRIDPFSGKLAIGTWRTRPKKSVTEQLPLGNTTGDAKKSRYLRWSTYPDIETAIRMTVHVTDKYKAGGIIEQNNQAVQEMILGIHHRLTNETVTATDLKKIHDEAYVILLQNGFITAQNDDKLEISDFSLRAASLDSRERVNSGRSALLSVEAYIRQLQVQLGTGKIRAKFGETNAILTLQREHERLCLAEVIKATRNFQPISDVITLSKMLLTADNIRTEPYRIPAMLFGRNITKTADSDTEDLLRRINNLGILDEETIATLKEASKFDSKQSKALILTTLLEKALQKGDDGMDKLNKT